MEARSVVAVSNLSKVYKIYNKPMDRVYEALRLSRKKFHTDFLAVNDVSFHLNPGDILGIMGRNGSGKSTLLKMITGVLTPTYGTIKVNGRISSLLELGAGFNMEYSGIENIYFYGTLMGMTTAQMDARVEDIIEFAEIGDYIYQPVKTYSSGMFARLAFSCAISVEPDVLIVDEILSVGDIRFQAKCFNRFKAFKKQGITILYVGHDISLMRTFCDTCIWMNNGKIVDMGDPVYISSKYTEFMYLDEISEFTEYHRVDGEGRESKGSLKEKNTAKEDADDHPSEEKLSFEHAVDMHVPLAHWGSKKGAITNITFSNSNRDRSDYFYPGEEIVIGFDVEWDSSFDYEYLSAAFSLKNKEGIDLVVRSTYDLKLSFLSERSNHVEFHFNMNLTSGEYYLVLALENHTNAIISYYEYIEGARYFKVFSDQDMYGMFLIETHIVLNEEEYLDGIH